MTKQALSGSITSMSHTITGLSSNTNVYARTYLISNFGTRYGSVRIKATGSSSNTAPTVVSTSFNSSTNKFTGTITSNGGSTAGTNGITEKGWVYSSSDSTPTIGETGVVKVQAPQSTISAFPHSYTSLKVLLTQNTQYYWRAYAKNDVGTSYGAVSNFTTANTSVGIGGFTLQSSSVSGNGGYVNIDVIKNVSTGTASGTISVQVRSSNSVLQSETVSVAFTNNQTIDSVQVYVPANYSGSARYITFKVDTFTSISNNTGSSIPVSISGVVNQPASSFNP